MSSVSWAIARRRTSGSDSTVRMLWSRSASFISTTRTSSAMATSILRTFSACACSGLWKEIFSRLVTPATSLPTVGPKLCSRSEMVRWVSSTVSWRIAAASVSRSSWRSARMAATLSGCSMNFSPDRRFWSWWALAAASYARETAARPPEERPLDLLEQRRDRHAQLTEWDGLLGAVQATDHGRLALGQVARTDLDAQRNTLQLPLVELESRPLITPIHLDADVLQVGAHLLDRGRVLGARKLLALGLATREDRDGAPLLGDAAIAVEHLRDFFFGLRRGLVKGMALLPEELAGAQEESRAQLPAKDVVPLVGEYRQVAIGLNVIAQHRRDHRLRGRAQHERFLEILAAAFGDELKFGFEAGDVVFLLLQETERNQRREVPVLVPGFLDETVQRIADVFPQRVAIGANDHGSGDGGIVR